MERRLDRGLCDGVGSALPSAPLDLWPVLLVWIYYSAQLILLGAEFTRCYATRFGHWVVATKAAVADRGEGHHGANLRDITASDLVQ